MCCEQLIELRLRAASHCLRMCGRGSVSPLSLEGVVESHTHRRYNLISLRLCIMALRFAVPVASCFFSDSVPSPLHGSAVRAALAASRLGDLFFSILEARDS